MNVVGESNPGRLLTRSRNRRRATDLNARSREAEVSKPAVVNGATSGATSVPIVVDDEDDDVVVSSPRSFAQAKSNVVRQEPRRVTRQSVVHVQDDPLELRLGPGGPSAFRIRSMSQCNEAQPLQVRWVRPVRPTVDLTMMSEDCVVLSDIPQSRKRKEHLAVERPKPKEKELKLVCAICMDTMKQETSTVCGHIFCQSCIQGAIQAQKKCPTCRRKLLMKDIHRIYIQSSTD